MSDVLKSTYTSAFFFYREDYFSCLGLEKDVVSNCQAVISA